MEAKRSFKPWMITIAVVVVAMAVLVACGSSSSASSGGSSSTPAATSSSAGGSGGGTAVAIANYAFTPQKLTVKAGTKVTWTNNDSVPHNVTSAADMTTSATTTNTFASGNFDQGQTFSYTFAKAGTYYYECTIHASMPAMHGEIIVQ